ncbi:DUF1127 domain-containing protein [Sneathiella limimaris]|uniref:DUF1127 domain-containing protein n=1 Tax=Sneathiella limimaris TaxID=1964213 RepID=UPI00146F898E|nr:DUF1127 domain-containing protein [Sneathiella limimaris]
MSVQATNYTKPASPAAGTFRTYFGKLTNTLVQKYRTYRTATELYALTDSELKDIGLTRGEIARVASRTHF